jgi:hypothetical protein
MNILRTALVGMACTSLLAPAALAGHGKVGTWQITTTMGPNNTQMGGMPDLSKLPPEVQARMKARGVQMNAGGGMTAKYCMTDEQVKMDKPPMTRPDSPCKTENIKVTGHTFSADVVCTGKMNGHGHTEMTFDSAEHYHGHQTMTMTVAGRTMTHDMFMDAKWLTPNCTVPAKPLPVKH